jgi:hypothetical protein
MTQSSATKQSKDAIRSFQVNVPEAELTDLRTRTDDYDRDTQPG